jgi:hypothetical protein
MVEAVIWRRMRAIFRLLLGLAVSVSIAATMLPARGAVPQPEKASCCAKMKMDAPTKGCEHHAPKSEQDKQCCAACSICLALFLIRATPFLYPPAGEESYATLSARAHIRSHRPPVPPPRA